MTMLDRIKELANNRKITLSRLEEDLGFGKNSLYSWKNKTPGVDKIQKVADYFDVSVDYLLGRNVPNDATPKDMSDLKEFLRSGKFNYGGENASDETIEEMIEYAEWLFWKARKKRLENENKKEKS